MLGEPIDLLVLSGSASHRETITVETIDGNLTSDLSSIDLSTNQTATLTLSSDAVDGTPIAWYATNGQITGSATVQSGQATATLSSTGAEMRRAVVTALVGGKLFVWAGEFTATGGLHIGVQDKVVTPGLDEINIEYPPAIGGSYTFAAPRSTYVFIKGQPNSTVTVSAPASVGFPSLDPPGFAGGAAAGQVIVRDVLIGPSGRVVAEMSIDEATPAGTSLPITVSDGQQTKQTAVKTADPAALGLGASAVKALLGQGSDGGHEVILELAGSIFLPEIQDATTIFSNFAKLAGAAQREFNAAETMWAVASLATSFIPGGAIAKRGAMAVGKIAGKLGKNSKFSKVLTERWAKAKRLSPDMQGYADSGELAFVERIVDDDVLLHKLNAPQASNAYVSRCVKIDQKIGAPFWDKIKQIDATPEEVGKIVNAFGDASDEAFDLMRHGGTVNGNTLETAIDGVHAAVKDGHTQKSLQRVLNKSNLDTPHYNRIDMLTDLGRKDADGFSLAEKPGMKEMVSKMSDRGWGRKGVKYQLQCAADLQAKGYDIRAVEKKIGFDKGNYTNTNATWQDHWQTDIDIVAVKNGQTFNCQVKNGAGALNRGSDAESMAEAARTLSNWIGAAKKKDGIGSVKIVVPPGTVPGQNIRKVLTKYGLVWENIIIESATP